MIDPWSATGIRVRGVDGFDAYRDILSTSTMEGYLKQETANALMKGTCTWRLLSNGCFSNVDSPHESFLGDVGCPLCQLLPSYRGDLPTSHLQLKLLDRSRQLSRSDWSCWKAVIQRLAPPWKHKTSVRSTRWSKCGQILSTPNSIYMVLTIPYTQRPDGWGSFIDRIDRPPSNQGVKKFGSWRVRKHRRIFCRWRWQFEVRVVRM